VSPNTDSAEVDKRAGAGGDHGAVEGLGGGCDDQVGGSPRLALGSGLDEQTGMDFGDVEVVVEDRDVS
jgi:hypothetical protein